MKYHRRAMLGTRWVESGQGHPWVALRDAIYRTEPKSVGGWSPALERIPKRAPSLWKRTNLSLTGESLQPADIENIGRAQ